MSLAKRISKLEKQLEAMMPYGPEMSVNLNILPHEDLMRLYRLGARLRTMEIHKRKYGTEYQSQEVAQISAEINELLEKARRLEAEKEDAAREEEANRR